MQPILLNTQLTFKRYYNANLYILLRRKLIWIMLGLVVVMLVLAIITGDDDHTYAYLAIIYLAFVLCFPLFIYFSAKRQFNKIDQMREPKVYEFSAEGIKLSSETVKMELAWSNVNKAVKRKDDFMLFSSNSRNFFYLPNDGFEDGDNIVRFESLVKGKVAKRNF